MPTYQYSCNDCGRSLEVVQKFTDDSLTECPECGGRLRKVFNAVGVVFKGSGFYRTDSRGSNSAGETSAPTKSGDSGADSGSTSASGAKETVSSGSSASSSTPSASAASSSGGSTSSGD